MNGKPKRRKREKMGVKQRPQVRCPAHLQWVRGHECVVKANKAGSLCNGKIEAAHVRSGTDGALGVKPSDYWTIPLCTWHHAIQGAMGEKAFEDGMGIDMKLVAKGMAQRSPHRKKWEV